MGRDAMHRLTVTGVKYDEVMTLLKSVGETQPEDLKDQRYGGKPFSPEEYDNLTGYGVVDKMNTVAGFHCATIEWLSLRFPTAMFIYTESSYDWVSKTIYIGGKRCDYDQSEFMNFLISKLGNSYDTLLKEYVEKDIADRYDENGNRKHQENEEEAEDEN